MSSWLDRGWRVIATAIAFLTFGVGGVVLRLAYFPLLFLLVADPAARQARARLAVHRLFRHFIEMMRFLGILGYRVEGLEKLNRRGLLILANHPTLLDIVFLISLVPNADCVVKASLARNIFTRGPVRATNYICNDSGPALVEDCIASLRTGSSLIIFPEGTRTPVRGSPRLLRGAANIAVRGGVNVTPVAIRCMPPSLTKGLSWWKVPAEKLQFTVEVHDDIAVAPFLSDAAGEAPLAARELTHHLQDHFFSREGQAHAGA